MPRRKKIQPEPDPEAGRPEDEPTTPEQPSEPEEAPSQDVATGPAVLTGEVETERPFTTRDRFRDDLLDAIRSEGDNRAVEIEGGPLDGVRVLSFGKLEELLDELGAEPIPPADARYAEVRTPAIVYVDAYCPRCGLPGLIAMTVGAELRATSSKSELRLQAKATSRPHVCGQLLLPKDVVEGQTAVDDAIAEAESIIDEAVADNRQAGGVEPDPADVEGMPSEDAEDCPFPGCRSKAEHEGDHDIDEDLLPS